MTKLIACVGKGSEILICKNCDITFKAFKSTKRKFCSNMCSVNYNFTGKPAHNKGKPFSEETKRKLGISHKKMWDEGRMSHRKTLSGDKHPNKRPEARLRNSLRQLGEKHWNWQGGKSLEPYGKEFNNQLKRKIRRRDEFLCQCCNINEKDLIRKLDVHHIDCDKQNNSENNLLSICRSCHNKKHPIYNGEISRMLHN